ncbi:MAG: preprotein translocase subunit SecE [Erysipelotrichaceae bacterium]|nr:preprotein translocase subunit SecE [Erysipelotrichaceae bacterium]
MLKWFSLSGIIKEAKRIRWPKRKDLFKDSSEVIMFTLAFALGFVAFDVIIAFILRFLGVGA